MTAHAPTAQTPNAADYLPDAKGRLVPRRLIKEADLARNDLVNELAQRAKAMSEQLVAFKRAALADIHAFVDLSAQEYGAKLGGEKGNVSLASYDGKYKVRVDIAERLAFDERLVAAKKLIDECIVEWAKGSSDEIRVLVEDAFQVDKAGKISTERVLGLRRLKIDNATWQQAMTALSDSISVVSSCAYVRVYERDDETGAYHAIPLDLSSV